MVRFPEGALTNSDKARCPRRNRICGTERAAYPLSPRCASGSTLRIINMAEISSMRYSATSYRGIPLLRAALL
jgi:hypothetical protein